MTGTVLALDQVPDATFASGLLGNGAAIIPADNKVIAPFAGEVASLFQYLNMPSACSVQVALKC